MSLDPLNINEDLLDKFQDGNKEAWELLYKEFTPMLISLVYKFLGHGFDCGDMVQKIFIEIYKNIRSFKSNSSIKTWIYSIAWHTCCGEIRKKQVRQKHFSEGSANDIEVVDKSNYSNPIQRMEQEERNKVVNDALNKLDPKWRIVIILHDMENIKIKEISKIVKKAEGTVKSRLFYARKELAKIIEETGFEL